MAVNFPSPYTVQRFPASDYDSNGVWVNVEPATVTINANIQPVSIGANRSNSQIMQMVSALGLSRLDGLIAIRSNEQIYADRKETGQKADRITYKGQSYQVMTASCRDTLPALAHWVGVGQLIDEKTLEPEPEEEP